ncbi:hypothetical protein [Sinorhizobium americanum]|uniref:Uncharacterized protein n=1 Tax=Sinorhizobium americanum TaxID=194963 RepID=A0A1L3LUW1_9HYPH|nr:hypothetical protein [Sinorhizobium americanum]APG93851.1 hypothetical protein SAMCFNEI73_pC0127 [Sinorhizobium americanum]
MKKVTPEMVEAALRATDFAVNATSRRWMKAALVAALTVSKVEPFERSSKHADDD